MLYMCNGLTGIWDLILMIIRTILVKRGEPIAK